jgi:hypothetical protein
MFLSIKYINLTSLPSFHTLVGIDPKYWLRSDFRVVSLVPFNFNIGTIILQFYNIFANGNLFTNCTNGIPVAGILNNGSLY